MYSYAENACSNLIASRIQTRFIKAGNVNRTLSLTHVCVMQNVVVVDALGALLAEVGPHEEAIEALNRAVELSPDSGFEKYMCGGPLPKRFCNH